jgi:integrase
MPETRQKPPAKKLLDQVRDAIRTKHYALRTEEAYVNWVRRFILFHGKRHPKDMGGPEIEAFLTHLAVEGHVSASTQNQALSALLFLYGTVLHLELDYPIDSVRAKPSQHLPEVLTKDEARQVIAQLSGIYQLQAKLLYCSGLRLLECLRLRVKNLDFERRALIVRDTKAMRIASRYCPTASLNRSRSTCCASGACTRRIWPRAAARSICPTRWIANSPTRHASGSGNTSSLQISFRRTRAPAWYDAIILTRAICKKRCAPQHAPLDLKSA